MHVTWSLCGLRIYVMHLNPFTVHSCTADFPGLRPEDIPTHVCSEKTSAVCRGCYHTVSYEKKPLMMSFFTPCCQAMDKSSIVVMFLFKKLTFTFLYKQHNWGSEYLFSMEQLHVQLWITLLCPKSIFCLVTVLLNTYKSSSA